MPPTLSRSANLEGFILRRQTPTAHVSPPSLFELLDLRGETAAYLPLLHSTEPNMFSPAVCRILREDIVSSRNMLILDRLEILPEFRRQRLGFRYIRTALKRFGSGCRIAALKPFPLQFERTLDDPDLDWRARMNLDSLSRETRSATTKLEEYYRGEGFIPVRGTDLMILDLSHSPGLSIRRHRNSW
jgi:hypothetical protein